MLAFNADEFQVINKMCSGVSASHRHSRWGVDASSNKFATALETAYPFELARLIALQFVAAFQRMGLKGLPETMSDITNLDSALLPVLRAQSGVQSKVSKLPPMIPTFAAKILVTGFDADLPAYSLLTKLASPLHVATVNAPTCLPKGSKLLSASPPVLPSKALQGGALVSSQQLSQQEIDRMVEQFQTKSIRREGVCSSQLWGVPWSEEDFIEQMVQRGHPTSLHSCLPEVLKEAADVYSKTSAHERMAYRADRLGFWLRRLHDLRQEEAALKASMHEDVAGVLKHKNVLLWEHMLKSCEYCDMNVVKEFMEGTELVGSTEKTGLWPMKFVPASMSSDDLEKVAERERPGLAAHYERLDVVEHATEVWAKTMQEQADGILAGPYDLSAIPDSFPLSRRFGILQGSKIRCIDDFSMSSVNSCVQCCESPKPHTLDVFAAVCAYVMGAVPNAGGWVGRTFDLTGAYRQCAVHPKAHKHSHIMVMNPHTGKLTAFRMKALPFGAIRSVHSFLRVAYSLWFILVREFKVLTTNYFDDFVTLGTSDEAPALKSCVHLVFKMLGWVFAESGAKAPEFAQEFQALGVLVSVNGMDKGLVTFGNTQSRRTELLQLIDEVLSTGKMSRIMALKLRGRLQFASANIFGRIAKAALNAVSNHAYVAQTSQLSDDTRLALVLHAKLLKLGKPRQLKTAESKCWFLQTDASFSNDGGQDVAGVGAILFDPCGRAVAFFSEQICAEVLRHLDPLKTKKTIIFECEFLALFAAFWRWGSEIKGALVIYTDNNGVRDTMISCSTKNAVARQIMIACLVNESDLALWPWYDRIPTDSNSADAPSRFDIRKLLAKGVRRDKLDMFECWNCVQALCEKWGDDQAARSSRVQNECGASIVS